MSSKQGGHSTVRIKFPRLPGGSCPVHAPQNIYKHHLQLICLYMYRKKFITSGYSLSSAVQLKLLEAILILWPSRSPLQCTGKNTFSRTFPAVITNFPTFPGGWATLPLVMAECRRAEITEARLPLSTRLIHCPLHHSELITVQLYDSVLPD